MTDYVINFTDPLKLSFVIKPLTTDGPLSPNAAIPLDPQAVSAHTSIVLLGKGMFEYGERVAESFVHMLENFANGTAPAYPIEGQLWFKNTPPKGLFVWDGVSWLTINIGSLPVTADLDMGGFKIINLGTPTLGTDATTKNYVDGRVLNDLADVIITAPFLGQILEFDGVNWINTASGAPTTLAGLTDVNIAAPANGQFLTYNFGLGKWENTTHLIPSTLDDLTDVVIVAPVLNQTLTYNGVNWVNATPPADRYVTSASLSAAGVLTINFSTATPSLSITATGSTFAIFGHFHVSKNMYHNVFYPAASPPPVPATTLNSSFFRQQLIEPYPQSLYPGANTVQAILALADEELYTLQALNTRTILQGDGITTTFVLDGDYTAGRNKLSVSINGVKQYASQRFSLSIQLDTSPINEGTDTTLADGTYTFDIVVNGTTYTGGTAPTVTVAEDRTITAVAVTPTNTWTISGNHATELGAGTYVTVTGNGFGPANTTYKVLSATDIGPDTVLSLDVAGSLPPGGDLPGPVIPVGATASGTLRKGYYFQQLREDLEATFLTNTIPVTVAFRDSVFRLFDNVVGSTSSIYIPPGADGLFPTLPTFNNYVYNASIVGNSLLANSIDRADNTTNPDEFDVFGNYVSSFPTGVRFVVFGSTGNDGEYITVAPATFAGGKTTIKVTDGSISVNEATGTGTGSVFFARDLGFQEVGAQGTTQSSIIFPTAPADGAVIETISQP